MTTAFETIHEAEIIGKLTTYDRMIFPGHLLSFFGKNSFGYFLARHNVLLEDFGSYAESITKQLRAHVENVAAASGREVKCLESARTAKRNGSKEDLEALSQAEPKGEAVAVLDGLCRPGEKDGRASSSRYRKRIADYSRM